jgi:hypothetical protein
MRGIDFGALSPAELEMCEPESHRLLRIQLEDQAYEAEAMVKWYSERLQTPAPWELIQEYGQWVARLALVRDKQERMRFGQ